MKLGKNDDALKLLNEEIANSPGYARAWSNRAVIHFQRGELTSAREDAQNALRLGPNNPQAQNLLNLLSAPAASAPQR
jgi:Flp pilus assembly protein TadD